MPRSISPPKTIGAFLWGGANASLPLNYYCGATEMLYLFQGFEVLWTAERKHDWQISDYPGSKKINTNAVLVVLPY